MCAEEEEEEEEEERKENTEWIAARLRTDDHLGGKTTSPVTQVIKSSLSV